MSVTTRKVAYGQSSHDCVNQWSSERLFRIAVEQVSMYTCNFQQLVYLLAHNARGWHNRSLSEFFKTVIRWCFLSPHIAMKICLAVLEHSVIIAGSKII